MVGKLRRTVKFAADNTYRKPFEIRYGTLASGAIVVHHDVDNPEHGKQLTPFLGNAQSYVLKFSPATKEPWPYLHVDVYKGFDRRIATPISTSQTRTRKNSASRGTIGT